MIIGVPKEIKDNEYRVSLTPAGASVLSGKGHQVLVEASAGQGSGFTDEEYRQAGASIVNDAAEVWARSEMIMKVKEPLASEFGYFRSGLILFTYLHLAAAEALAHKLVETGVTSVAYETIQLPNGSLPLLTPMSEVAGRMSVQLGARFLEHFHGGSGVLLGGVPGVPPADVVILGGGIVGANAAKIALGMGANVVIVEKSADRMRYLDDVFGGRLHTLMSNSYNIAEAVRKADLLIGAVLIPGAKAPKLVTEEMVSTMKPGAVIVDVAIDQGGTIATINRATTHSQPTYVKHGVVHYAVPNIPGAVPRTSTLALTNVTLPYAMELAGSGVEEAARLNSALAFGLNTYRGAVTHPAIAQAVSLPYTKLSDLL
ncbi:alanine dehydrogenase [Paenibacillus sp. J2TS4]|uniref:alanine dehydrogenase n=1 Tax=Paenibacillus sp. J2TS4 TaxID=2807194 RepID=UPI001AFDEA6F|nr:alanine dehydrogenase [Paenibacillus sp. J2TS4]GIP32307.1 alanine dehydrogenase [Paenibacillus sp. J2TS4]